MVKPGEGTPITERTRTVLMAMLNEPKRWWFTSDLASTCDIPTGTVPTLVGRLVRWEWVETETEPGHHVRKRARLTAAGAEQARVALFGHAVRAAPAKKSTPAPPPPPAPAPAPPAPGPDPAPVEHAGSGAAWIRKAAQKATSGTPDGDDEPMLYTASMLKSDPHMARIIRQKLAAGDYT